MTEQEITKEEPKPLKFKISFEIPPLQGQEETIVNAIKMTMPVANNITVEKIYDVVNAEEVNKNG